MTVEELRKLLYEKSKDDTDRECRHSDMDELLLEYINDEEVTKIFNETEKWYA